MPSDPKSPRPSSAEPSRDNAGARVVGWLLFALVVVFGGAFVAAHFVAGDKVPRGTTVSGVHIGGHPQAEAAQALQAGLADRVDRPIEVTVEGKTTTIEPHAVGLSVDYAASVAEAGGKQSWDPVRLWNYFTGGDELQAEVSVDGKALDLRALTNPYREPGVAVRMDELGRGSRPVRLRVRTR